VECGENLDVLEIVKIAKCCILHYLQGEHNLYEFEHIYFVWNSNFEMFKNQRMVNNYKLNLKIS
jgi:hypothetical protein